MNDLFMKPLPGLLRDMPGFRLYAICAIILAIKMYTIGAATAVIRTRRKVILNPEDARQSGLAQASAEPPTWSEPCAPTATTRRTSHPIAFTVARVLHSIVYLKALQPWRTMSFGIGQLTSVALSVMILIRAFGD